MSSILGGRFKPGYSPLGSVRRNALFQRQGMDYAGREAMSGAVTPTAIAPIGDRGLEQSRHINEIRSELRQRGINDFVLEKQLENRDLDRQDRAQQRAMENQRYLDTRDYRRQRDAAVDQYRNALLQARTAPKAAKSLITPDLFSHFTPESIQAYKDSGGNSALVPIDKSDPIKIEQAFKLAREPKLHNYVDNYGFEIKGMGGVQAYNEAVKNYRKELSDYLSGRGITPPSNYQSTAITAPPTSTIEPKITPVTPTPKTSILGKLFGTQNAGASGVPLGYKYSNPGMQPQPVAQAEPQPAPRSPLISDATASSLTRRAANAIAPLLGGDNLNDYYDATEGKTLPLGNPLGWRQNQESLDSANYAKPVQRQERMITGMMSESPSTPAMDQAPNPPSSTPLNNPANIAKQKLDIVRGMRSALTQPQRTYDMGGISPTVNDTTAQDNAPIPASAIVQSQGVRDDLNHVHSTPAAGVPGYTQPDPLALQPGQTDARKYVDLTPKTPLAAPERMIRLNDQATVPDSAINNMEFESNVRELMARRPHLSREQAMQFVMQSQTDQQPSVYARLPNNEKPTAMPDNDYTRAFKAIKAQYPEASDDQIWQHLAKVERT